MLKISIQTNGYTADKLQDMIKNFESAANKLFEEGEIKHFYYGDSVDMLTLSLPNNEYGHFNIYAKRVSLCGLACSNETFVKLQKLTYKDECYHGELLQLA